jgi:hypothetical protein
MSNRESRLRLAIAWVQLERAGPVNFTDEHRAHATLQSAPNLGSTKSIWTSLASAIIMPIAVLADEDDHARRRLMLPFTMPGAGVSVVPWAAVAHRASGRLRRTQPGRRCATRLVAEQRVGVALVCVGRSCERSDRRTPEISGQGRRHGQFTIRHRSIAKHQLRRGRRRRSRVGRHTAQRARCPRTKISSKAESPNYRFGYAGPHHRLPPSTSPRTPATRPASLSSIRRPPVQEAKFLGRAWGETRFPPNLPPITTATGGKSR